MSEPTKHDLHVYLTRLECKLDTALAWQKEHAKQDGERFTEIEAKLDSMNKYVAGVSAVSVAIGYCAAWLKDKIT